MSAEILVTTSSKIESQATNRTAIWVDDVSVIFKHEKVKFNEYIN